MMCGSKFGFTLIILLVLLKKESVIFRVKVQREKPPLYMMEIVILGRLSRGRPELKKVVEGMGGKIVTQMHANTAVVVTTQNIFDKMGEKIMEAQSLGIQVLLEDFFTAVEGGAKAVDYISKFCISDWGSDVGKVINVQITISYFVFLLSANVTNQSR